MRWGSEANFEIEAAGLGRRMWKRGAYIYPVQQ
jgi:hypothetical protein